MTEVGSWLTTWRALGVADSPELRTLHADLLSRYSEPHRRYHTPQHLAECFEKAHELLDLAEHPSEIVIALWFHDAIYDTQRHDNEERSAIWARDATLNFGVEGESAQRLHDLILCTRHAAAPTGIDERILVDADLAILGAPAARFDEYEAQVRIEYAWVPETTFRTARASILKEFLNRTRLYNTDRFYERYDAQARQNLSRSLAKLEGRGTTTE